MTEAAETQIDPPAAPMSVAETGLSRDFLLKLLAKTLNVFGTMTPSQLANELRLSVIIVNDLLKELQKLLMVEARGLAGSDMRAEVRFSLGGKGHQYALEAAAQSQYVGPAPVSLDDFVAQVGRQSIRRERISRAQLAENLAGLVLPSALIDQLGPAINSASSILLYGSPGNGKTSIAEAAGKAFKERIYVPYCIEVGGQVINFFDPVIHTPENGELKDGCDPRWQRCKRPVVVTGGELNLEMLDLVYNSSSRYYEAPAHIKATGGVFIVDDFGRQRTDPQSILNRWIVPLERGFDQLTLHTGKKFPVLFDQLVIFSTNIAPEKLSDSGGLRRLHYKIHIPSPTPEDYRKIFFDVLGRNGLTLPEPEYQQFFEHYYGNGNNPISGYHPKYIVDYALSSCAFRQVPNAISLDLIEAGFENLYANHRD